MNMIAVRSLLHRTLRPVRVAGKTSGAMAVLCALSAQPIDAQGPPMHWQHADMMPPGAIGGQRLGRGGPLSGYFQPVVLRGPEGVSVAWAVDGQFGPNERMPVTLGMLIAPVYRLRVANIPNHFGAEVFPTVEIIDRLYPPPEEVLRFPIPIEISQQDLEMALEGNFVTRVIYVEDPDSALPHTRTEHAQNWFDVAEGDDPLDVADRLGRPVAILRIGGRVPGPAGPEDQFLAGSPPVTRHETLPPRQPTPLPAAVRHYQRPRGSIRP